MKHLNRVRKTPIAAVKRRMDKNFSLYIRGRGHCESGREKHAGVLQCAHGFSRRYTATRWDTRNAWCLCAGCHKYYTHHPIEWDEWMRSRMENYEAIRLKAIRGSADWIDEDFLSIDEHLKALVSLIR